MLLSYTQLSLSHFFHQDYLGPATELKIAEHISTCHGPSGSNVEYALKLSIALERLGVCDPHVGAIARYLNVMGFTVDSYDISTVSALGK